MSNIRGINGYNHTAAIGPPSVNGSAGSVRPSEVKKQQDQVEISQIARFMSQIAAMPDIRQEKVEEIRQQLASGNYDLDEKLPAALEKLLEEHSLE